MGSLFGDSSDNNNNFQLEEMEDTPWITQAREIADVGGKGILENYNKVNTFNEDTQKSLEARNNAIYNRAFSDAEKEYTNTMNKYNAANYNQFGTLNATPSTYRTDQYNQDFQRRLDDMAYNKAINYDTLMDKELSRRYNTLNMYGNLYNYGQTPYQQDVANWNVRNTNAYNNYLNNLQKSQSSSLGNIGNIMSALGSASSIFNGTGTFGSNLNNIIGTVSDLTSDSSPTNNNYFSNLWSDYNTTTSSPLFSTGSNWYV